MCVWAALEPLTYEHLEDGDVSSLAPSVPVVERNLE